MPHVTSIVVVVLELVVVVVLVLPGTVVVVVVVVVLPTTVVVVVPPEPGHALPIGRRTNQDAVVPDLDAAGDGPSEGDAVAVAQREAQDEAALVAGVGRNGVERAALGAEGDPDLEAAAARSS